MNTGLGQVPAPQGSNNRKAQPRLRIGAWQADPNLDEIACAGRLVKLEPRAMRLLLYLAANRNRVVGLSEMLDEIWPNVVVTSQSVYSTIAQLRQILGDSADAPTYIATVPRKGYRLIAEVADCPETIALPVTTDTRAEEPPPVSALATPAPSVTGAALPATPQGPVSGRFWAIVMGSVVAAGLAALLYMRLHQPAARASAGATERLELPTAAPSLATVAVLPFLDLSEGNDFEYFSDGLTEELIDLLAHNSSLRVPARTSSFYFKGKAAPIADIARQLNVANLLEGSVRRSGNTVRVTAQLIRAADGYHLWSETFDRKDSDDLAVEDDIAGKVAETLRATLTPRAALGIPSPLDNATRNLLLECQFYVTRNTPDYTLKSLACFEKVLAASPKSAHAWAAYANALFRKPHMVEESKAQQHEDSAAGERAARHALQLDPDSSTAHAALANYLMNSEFNWAAAKQELDAALKSDPNDPVALLSACRLAEYLGNFDELIASCNLARDRDPLNFLAYARLGIAYLRLGRYQEAEGVSRRRLDISPDGGGGHYELALALLMQGRLQEGRAEIGRESDGESRQMGDEIFYQALGRRADADAGFEQIVQRYKDEDPMLVAQLSAYRGDSDRAFEALNAGVSARSVSVYLVKVDFFFNGLREDPRYHLLLQRMHLPD